MSFGRTQIGTVLLGLLVAAHAEAAVIFSDSSVSNSGQWSTVVDPLAPAAGLYVLNTGNSFQSYPANPFRVTGFPHSNAASIAWGVGNLYTGGTYSPPVDGEVATIDFSYTTRKGSLDGVRSAFLIIQGGKYYRSNFFTQLPGGSTPLETNAQVGLLASNFGEFVGKAYDYTSPADGTANFASNPDFSSSGGTMQFGYLSHFDSSIVDPASTVAYQMTTTWSVTFIQVPEPSFAAGAIAGAALLRRKRP